MERTNLVERHFIVGADARKELRRFSPKRSANILLEPKFDAVLSRSKQRLFLGEKTGVVYVLALPWMNDAIGYNSHEEIINLRLVSICPPQAQRPFFQEGYLAGQFPNYKLDAPKRSPQFDLSRRVIAKFCFDINQDFWGSGFMNIPEDKLYPGNDVIGEICLKIREEMGG
ncbi:MAG: hypothetical protein NW218_00015 [Saprospiraceae bacterium]|nr:hypothetical protein [Saprospiraceae bacterium]